MIKYYAQEEKDRCSFIKSKRTFGKGKKIYENAPETVRAPAQQKAYDRWCLQQMVAQEKLQTSITTKPHKKKKHKGIIQGQPRARILRGGLPSLGKVK